MENILLEFPPGFTPRPIQRDILVEINERLSSGYKKIILSAPTGVGKSLIAATVARHCQSSFIVTASKQLQDQYSREMGFLRPVKGKSNFACRQLMDDHKVSDLSDAKANGLTCEKGQCVRRVQKDGRELTETCQFKPGIRDIGLGVHEADACQYYVQKYVALVAPHSLWNYSSYFQVMKYNQDAFTEYLDRRIAIFDEAHKIEDQIVQFIGIDMTGTDVRECQLDADSYDLESIDDIISLADSMADHYAKQLRDIESNGSSDRARQHEMASRMQRKFEQASRARVEMLENKKNFVVNGPHRDGNGNFRSLSVKPIDISGYADRFFKADLQMFMSATLDRESFCENVGFDPDEVTAIDVPRSPFPAKNRRVDFLNVRSLNSRSSESDRMAIISKIDEIISGHAGQRGLVLTSSISWCNDILGGLSDLNRRRVLVCHSKNAGGRTQDEILNEHARISDSVLLSSSLWEGVDLKDDLSRFQIIAKVPYPNLAERRVREKKYRFPLWYEAQTVTKLLQGLGRSVRGEDDWARTYVLDSAAYRLLSGAGRRIPTAYRDVLGLGQHT